MASFKKLLLSLTLLLLVSQAFTYDNHECNHDDIEQNPGLLDIEEDTSGFGDEGRVLASVPNMRMYFHYDEVKKSAPATYAAYIQNELMPPIRDYYNAALRVKSPVVGNLKLGTSVSKICEINTPTSSRMVLQLTSSCTLILKLSVAPKSLLLNTVTSLLVPRDL
jgi:hypothetical protein